MNVSSFVGNIRAAMYKYKGVNVNEQRNLAVAADGNAAAQ